MACQRYVDDILGRILFHLEIRLSGLTSEAARPPLPAAGPSRKGRSEHEKTDLCKQRYLLRRTPGRLPRSALRLLAGCEKSVNFFVFSYALYNLTNMFYQLKPIISQEHKKRKCER